MSRQQEEEQDENYRPMVKRSPHPPTPTPTRPPNRLNCLLSTLLHMQEVQGRLWAGLGGLSRRLRGDHRQRHPGGAGRIRRGGRVQRLEEHCRQQ